MIKYVTSFGKMDDEGVLIRYKYTK